MTVDVTVIGVGNPWRRDDGAGPAVIARLRRIAPRGVEAVEESGEPGALVDRWSDRGTVVVVDAVRPGGSSPGTLHRLEWDADGVPRGRELSSQAPSGSHALGVPEAVALGRALGRLPRRLIVIGVEAGDVGFGAGLSPAVGRAVAAVVRLVLRETAAEAR